MAGPGVESITPSAKLNRAPVNVTILGHGFIQGIFRATFRISLNGGTPIPVTNTSVVSNTEATGTIDIDGAEEGLYDVIPSRQDFGDGAPLIQGFDVFSLGVIPSLKSGLLFGPILDESSGSVVTDKISGAVGSINGGVTKSQKGPGQGITAMALDGTGYLRFPRSAIGSALNVGTGPFSVAIAVKGTQSGVLDDFSTFIQLLAQGEPNIGWQLSSYSVPPSYGDFYMQDQGQTVYEIDSGLGTPSQPLDGFWHNLIANVDRDANMAYLYDGEVLAYAIDITGMGNLNNSDDLMIGSTAGGYFSRISVAAPRLWGRALSIQEILRLNNGGDNINFNRRNGNGIKP